MTCWGSSFPSFALESSATSNANPGRRACLQNFPIRVIVRHGNLGQILLMFLFGFILNFERSLPLLSKGGGMVERGAERPASIIF